jgi:hypothetical protein
MALGSKKDKFRWQKQEKEIAEKMKGKRTKGSGAGYTKGDVINHVFRVECKTTKFKSFSITERLLDKLDEDNFGSDKIPIMAIELENGKRKCYVLTDHALDLILGLK